MDPQLAALPVVQRITQSPVYQDPIVYVGDQPPDPVLMEQIRTLEPVGPALKLGEHLTPWYGLSELPVHAEDHR